MLRHEGTAEMIVIDLDRESLQWTADGDALNLDDSPASAWQLWVTVIYMGMRDQASSLHYQSWLGGMGLSYVCANTRYVIAPPPAGLSRWLVEVWLTHLESGWRKWLGRWTGHQATAGILRVVAGGGSYDWYASCWALPGAAGVDIHRVGSWEWSEGSWGWNEGVRPAPAFPSADAAVTSGSDSVTPIS
ncbi:hypothetical protein [Fimbriiglobus ruber]|nr:hypothetical protein [Fimbriiglobus ruber]